MKKYIKNLMRCLSPADVFLFLVFTVFQLVLSWWFRKLFFITVFLALLIYYLIYAVVFKVDRKLLLHKFDVIDLAAVLFVVALCVSSFLSEYKSFSVGILGEQEGIIMYLFYLAAFILLRRVIHFEEWHFYLFVAAGVVVSAVAIPVFFGVFRVFVSPAIFTTYTNVDMFSQMLAMYFAANFLLSLRQSDRGMQVFHFLAELLFIFCIIIAQCDGMIVFLAVFFIALPYIVKIDLTVIKRMILCSSALFFDIAFFNIFEKLAMPYAPSFLIIFAKNIPFYITLPIGAVLFAAALLIKTDKNKDFTRIYKWAFPGLITACVVTVFAFWKEPLLWYFDVYGGKRLGLIKTVFSAYSKVFSPVQKLFGTGMYSFGEFLENHCSYLIPKNLADDLIFPHNFISELIFETGAIGFITCGVFLGSAIKNAANQKDKCRQIAFVSVILYLVTRLFYVPSPEITPIVLLFLAGCCPVLQKKNSPR